MEYTMNLTHSVRRCLVLPALLALAALTGCASQITHQEMTPIKLNVAKTHPQSVTVTAIPKAGADAAASAAAMTELRTALTDAIGGYKVFAGVKPEGGDYQLTVQVFNIESPMFGASFTSKAELGWTLKRAGSGAVVWQESIKSEHTTSMSEAFVGAERQKLSIAGAIRQNIATGLEKIGALAL
jgi:hypothetical protein